MSCKYIYNSKEYTKEELIDFLMYNGKNINSLAEYNLKGDWQNDPNNASVVVDNNGEPLVQYHWGAAVGITEFNLSGLGSHFGTEEAAMKIESVKGRIDDFVFIDEETGYEETIYGEGVDGEYYEVYLNIRNPLILNDLGQHDISDYRDELKDAFRRQGVELTEGEINLIDNSNDARDVHDIMRRYGYDGFVYENLHEDPGSTSYIAITKSSIKSATDNVGQFNTYNNDIRYQSRPPVVRKVSELYSQIASIPFVSMNDSVEAYAKIYENGHEWQNKCK